MRKFTVSSTLILLILAILSTTTFQVSALTPHEEIEALRKNIRYTEDIDTEIFNRLEAAVLKKYTDVEKEGWYMSVMVKLVGLGALDGSLENTLDPEGTVTKAMLIKMLVRAIYGPDGLRQYNTHLDHWAARDVEKAILTNLLSRGEITVDNLSEPGLQELKWPRLLSEFIENSSCIHLQLRNVSI